MVDSPHKEEAFQHLGVPGDGGTAIDQVIRSYQNSYLHRVGSLFSAACFLFLAPVLCSLTQLSCIKASLKSGAPPALQMTTGGGRWLLTPDPLCFPELCLEMKKRPQPQGSQSQPTVAPTAGHHPPALPAHPPPLFKPSCPFLPVFPFFLFPVTSFSPYSDGVVLN